MNDAMKQKLTEAVGMVVDGMKKTGDFALDQAPLVAQEFIAWEIWYGALMFVGGLILFFVGVIGALKWFIYCEDQLKKCEKAKNNEYHSCGWQDSKMFMIFAIVPIIFGIAGICQIERAIKASVAPRIVIIEKMADIAK